MTDGRDDDSPLRQIAYGAIGSVVGAALIWIGGWVLRELGAITPAALYTAARVLWPPSAALLTFAVLGNARATLRHLDRPTPMTSRITRLGPYVAGLILAVFLTTTIYVIIYLNTHPTSPR